MLPILGIGCVFLQKYNFFTVLTSAKRFTLYKIETLTYICTLMNQCAFALGIVAASSRVFGRYSGKPDPDATKQGDEGAVAFCYRGNAQHQHTIEPLRR